MQSNASLSRSRNGALFRLKFVCIHAELCSALQQAAHVTILLMQVFGQVYIPVVNYVLMALTMIVVGTFQTSARLGEAYGEMCISSSRLHVWF